MILRGFLTLMVVVGAVGISACGPAGQYTAAPTQNEEQAPAAIRYQTFSESSDHSNSFTSPLPTQPATVEDPSKFPDPATASAQENDENGWTPLPVSPATVDPNAAGPKFTEEEIAKDRPAASDIVGTASLTPSVYFLPVFDEDKNTCPESEKVTLHGQGGKALIRVCRKNSKACGLQGSCTIKQKGKIRMLNILAKIDGQRRYFEINREECKYGYGSRSVCLDPFHSVAADLSVYKLGEVIYVPLVIGLLLPDGSLHDGYFVIRDKGSNINGRGRFDFYTGLTAWYDSKNPFNRINLSDKKTLVPYMRVTGAKAKEIQTRRLYPRIPADNQPLN